jgi:hypothetical protein
LDQPSRVAPAPEWWIRPLTEIAQQFVHLQDQKTLVRHRVEVTIENIDDHHLDISKFYAPSNRIVELARRHFGRVDLVDLDQPNAPRRGPPETETPTSWRERSSSDITYWISAIAKRAAIEYPTLKRACLFMMLVHRRSGLAQDPDNPASKGGSAVSRPSLAHLPFIAIRFTFCCAEGDFGSVTVRTPFLNEAATLSWSTSSTGIRRSKRP